MTLTSRDGISCLRQAARVGFADRLWPVWVSLAIVLIGADARSESRATPWVLDLPPEGELLATLRPEHPRLWIDSSALSRLADNAARDPLAAGVLDRLRDDAQSFLGEPPLARRLTDGRRLLSISAEMSKRIKTLALLYRLDGDPDYAQRAWREMESAAGFRDWNPDHFLDTGEMSLGLAIGYDWLYETLTPEQRQRIRTALVEKGLKPALDTYGRRGGWHKNDNNWNQVCNGGVAIAALAVADEEPELAEQVLRKALLSVPLAVGAYAPDGAGHEGVTYWGYGARFSVYLITALESALGDDFALSDTPGFLASADYGLYQSGADRTAMNFADCKARAVTTPQHLWFGARGRSPRHVAFRREALAGGLQEGGLDDLLWWSRAEGRSDLENLPLDRHFRGAEVASMRTSWTDPDAAVLAIQGGDNNKLRSHRQLDLGTFIYESQGVRWFIDQGVERQTYHTHRHGVPRVDFYRVRAEGHNTLVIDPGVGADQALEARADFLEFESSAQGARAVLDLSEAYPDWAVTRTFEFDRGGDVTIHDTIAGRGRADLWWFAHTAAEIEIRQAGRAARLRSEGKSLDVRLLSPDGAFEARPAAPLHASAADGVQELGPRVQKLAIRLEVAEATEIRVQISASDP